MVKPIVRYRFRVEGREYFGNRLRMAERGDRWGRYAMEMRAAYPAGARVDVYFDPKSPYDNVLRRGIDWGCGFGMCFGIAVEALGIFLMMGPHS